MAIGAACCVVVASARADSPAPEGRPAAAAEQASARPVPPPPIGTRFGEPLEGPRVRVGYRFARVKAQGLLIGSRDARPRTVRDSLPLDYEETPRALELSIHTIELAWAPHPRTTLALQVPFAKRELETLEASGARREDQTEGLGDVGLALVVPFIRRGRESSHVHVGFDFPSGSYRKRDRDGVGDVRLPYDLQLGNGTVDFEWGWTYRGERDRFAWGGQALGRHPLGRNGLDYREGSRFEASIWGGVRIVAGLSASLRTQWQKQNNHENWDKSFRRSGVPRDSRIEDVVDPAENGKARGGTRFLLGPGLAYDLSGRLAGNRFSVELALPVHQDLDGPQLEQDWILTTGWQWAF